MFELRRPCVELASSFERLRDALLLTECQSAWCGRSKLARTDVPAYIEAKAAWANGERLDGSVRSDRYWIVDGPDVVGEVDVRHYLTDRLREVAGHIGYLTHPEHRNKGVATFALRKALERLGELGVEEALVTCRPENSASIRVIEKCGGVRIADSYPNGRPHLRYTIAVSPRS